MFHVETRANLGDALPEEAIVSTFLGAMNTARTLVNGNEIGCAQRSMGPRQRREYSRLPCHPIAFYRLDGRWHLAGVNTRSQSCLSFVSLGNG